jgi:hypothetical protein
LFLASCMYFKICKKVICYVGVMGLTHHKFNANRVHAMWTIKGWRVTKENENICMQILCIQLRNPMTLQFDNVGHSMDWTMHFST